MTRTNPMWLAAAGVTGAATILLAACSSSSKSSAAPASAAAPAAAASPSTAAPSAGFVVSTANVPGVGTVLVNGSGRTLYLLSSEKGGKLTCTDANGCTKVWPDSELPKGVAQPTAGTGVQASLLGTVKNADGALYVTYNSYPLYTFSGDSGPGMANGENIKSFGGTWTAITPAGAMAAPSGGSTATTPAPASSSSGGGGYSY